MSNYQTIYNRLRQAGMTDAAALGFLGNWQQESGCEPNRLENDFDNFRRASRDYTARVISGAIPRQQFGADQKGYGLAQWTFVDQARTAGRKYDLYDFWKRSGKALDDVGMQVDFALYELEHGYRHVKGKLAGCADLRTATDIICRFYEQPANPNVDTRVRYAREIEAQIDKNQWRTAGKAEEGRQTVTKEEAIAKVLTIARNEIGYHEQGDNVTKYAAYLDSYAGFYNGPKNGFAWCDVFVDWCFVTAFGLKTGQQMLCQPDYSAGAGCLYSAQYYQQAGRFSQSPEPGDQIFFTYQAGEVSHTGIVESVTGSTVTTIEGNTSDSVARKSYPIGSGNIYGYGRPDWSLVATVSDSDTGTGAADDSPAPDPPAAEPVGGAEYQITLRELRKGDTGKPVERLQNLLIVRGYYCGGRIYNARECADGEFGPATEVAVKDVQLAANLTQDGIVGSETMTVLLTT